MELGVNKGAGGRGRRRRGGVREEVRGGPTFYNPFQSHNRKSWPKKEGKKAAKLF
jgi:hypothetical protein